MCWLAPFQIIYLIGVILNKENLQFRFCLIKTSKVLEKILSDHPLEMLTTLIGIKDFIEYV